MFYFAMLILVQVSVGCVTADFSQQDRGGIQAEGLTGFPVTGPEGDGFIFRWVNDNRFKMVRTNARGRKITSGWTDTISTTWQDPNTWNTYGYSTSNFQNNCKETIHQHFMCVTADFSQQNLDGIQAEGLTGFPVTDQRGDGFIFLWLDGHRFKMVRTNAQGQRITAGWAESHSTTWDDSSTWNTWGGYSISNFQNNCGCEPYSEEACRKAALNAGLELGGDGYEFAGDYGTKGCYAYVKAHGKYAGNAYYGTGGSVAEMSTDLQPKFRPRYYQVGMHVKLWYRRRRSGLSVPRPYSQEACEQAVQRWGLQLGGGGKEFAGAYETKGCYAYRSGEFKGMAFYGTGGSWREMRTYVLSETFRPRSHNCRDMFVFVHNGGCQSGYMADTATTAFDSPRSCRDYCAVRSAGYFTFRDEDNMCRCIDSEDCPQLEIDDFDTYKILSAPCTPVGQNPLTNAFGSLACCTGSTYQWDEDKQEVLCKRGLDGLLF